MALPHSTSDLLNHLLSGLNNTYEGDGEPKRDQIGLVGTTEEQLGADRFLSQSGGGGPRVFCVGEETMILEARLDPVKIQVCL